MRRDVGDVRRVQERGAFQTHIDEGGLHPRQDARYAAFVDIAHQSPAARPLDVDFLQDVVFEDGGPGLARRDVDQNLDRHRESPYQQGTPAARSNSAVSYSGRPMTPE